MRHHAILKILAGTLAALLLCGCSSQFLNGDRQLMRPPYPAGDERNIQEALTKSLGSFTMKYPKSGNYRSAIIRTDLTGDGKDDALVFYRQDESKPISLAVLSQNGDDWELLSKKEGEGGEIDRILFGDVNCDGVNEVIVGWTIYSSGLNIISAYVMQNGTLTAIDVKEYSESQGSNIPVAYTDMQIYDFDSDGSDEIIASYLNLSEISATAKLIECHRGVDDAFTMSVTDTVQLDGHVLSYAEAKVAKLTDDRVYGVVLDGYKDNSTMITEYIYWNSVNGDLEAPFYNDEEQAVTVSLRSVNITSRDIDSDGVVDIPVTEFLPGYDNTSEAPMYLTLWYNADFGAGGCSFQSKKKNIINLSEGYSVTWQNSWEKKVTCRLDEKNRTLYFYHYQKDRFAFSDELFRIRVFTHDEWKKDRHDPDNTVVLNETDESVCAAILSGNQDLVDRRIIEAAFSLI
jgi:hypothetical protein